MKNKVISLYTFNKRYEFEGNCVIDKLKNKIYFCPNDIGFTKSFEECSKSRCTECWNKVIKIMY